MNAQLNDPMYTFKPEGPTQMLIYENLARSRTREAEQVAQAHRLVRRLHTAKRWEQVAKWATRRADRASACL
ncbi:hypothetical protein [Actinokineospora sp. HUAS TT18]|uniref:hypothetical protein n=1 Tax=Actinokineospora sp. HUAS TT18 TaxID=3447451 RepID=UPI003F522A78